MGSKRKDKKLAKKAMKRIEKQKQKQSLLERPPNQNYKRQIIHTDMPWPLQVVLMGKKEVLIFIILVLAIITIAAAYGIYHLALFIMEML
mgnify:CR=1 FL=1